MSYLHKLSIWFIEWNSVNPHAGTYIAGTWTSVIWIELLQCKLPPFCPCDIVELRANSFQQTRIPATRGLLAFINMHLLVVYYSFTYYIWTMDLEDAHKSVVRGHHIYRRVLLVQWGPSTCTQGEKWPWQHCLSGVILPHLLVKRLAIKGRLESVMRFCSHIFITHKCNFDMSAIYNKCMC